MIFSDELSRFSEADEDSPPSPNTTPAIDIPTPDVFSDPEAEHVDGDLEGLLHVSVDQPELPEEMAAQAPSEQENLQATHILGDLPEVHERHDGRTEGRLHLQDQEVLHPVAVLHPLHEGLS